MRGCLVLPLLLSVLVEPAFSQISAPQVGLVRYADGGVYRVTGVPGNYIIGDRLFDAVEALNFSEAGGLMLRSRSLLLLDANASVIASYAAGAGKAVVGVQKKLDSSIAWLPSSNTIVHWDGATFHALAVPDGSMTGEVLSINKTASETALLIVRQPGGNVEEETVSLLTGIVLARSVIADPTADIFRSGDLTVTIQTDQLVLSSLATGIGSAVPIRAKNVQFERMSGTCLHLHSASSGRNWILQTTGDQPSLFELPPPPAAVLRVKAAQ